MTVVQSVPILILTFAGFLLTGCPKLGQSVSPEEATSAIHDPRLISDNVPPGLFSGPIEDSSGVGCPTALIRFCVVDTSWVSISVFNIVGACVDAFEGEMCPGVWSLLPDLEGHGSGVYFYRLEIDGKAETRKLVFLK